MIPATGTEVIIGDIDNDGTVTISDAVYIQKYLTRFDEATIIESDQSQFKAADANKDGVVNIRDVTTIQKYLAGIIISL